MNWVIRVIFSGFEAVYKLNLISFLDVLSTLVARPYKCPLYRWRDNKNSPPRPPPPPSKPNWWVNPLPNMYYDQYPHPFLPHYYYNIRPSESFHCYCLKIKIYLKLTIENMEKDLFDFYLLKMIVANWEFWKFILFTNSSRILYLFQCTNKEYLPSLLLLFWNCFRLF